MPLNERQAYDSHVLADGRVVDVVPLTFGRARLLISENVDTPFVSDAW